jgi:hypothetical protein
MNLKQRQLESERFYAALDRFRDALLIAEDSPEDEHGLVRIAILPSDMRQILWRASLNSQSQSLAEEHHESLKYTIFDLLRVVVGEEALPESWHDLTRESFHTWLSGFFDLVQERALLTVNEQDRAPCPLCHDTPSGNWAYSDTSGWLLPEGLKRHLTGYGNTSECSVIRAIKIHMRDLERRQM